MIRHAASKISNFFATPTSVGMRIRAGRGFTLIETVVAVALLSVVISGIMAAVYQSSGASRQAENRTTANYLAQEAIEYLRYSRDSAWKRGKSMTDWKTGTVSGCTGGSVCQIDTVDQTIDNCGAAHQDCELLHYNDSLSGDRSWYEYDNGTESSFKRSVRLSFADMSTPSGTVVDGRVKVDVTVTFDGGEVTVTDYLYRWNEG